MRRLFAFALILALLLATAAMGEETFLDDTGAPVSPEAPTRVAALSGSLAQIWLLAGGEVACVTQDALEQRDLGLPEDIAVVGTVKEPNAEEIIALEPDLVLLASDIIAQADIRDVLENAGISCAAWPIAEMRSSKPTARVPSLSGAKLPTVKKACGARRWRKALARRANCSCAALTARCARCARAKACCFPAKC